MSAPAAIAAALALVVFWLLHFICRTFGQKKMVMVWLAAWCWCWCVLRPIWLATSSRSGSLLADGGDDLPMSANVFFWIIPGQRWLLP